jgi:phage terminase Nu1 subunit (DNA packaging protein)
MAQPLKPDKDGIAELLNLSPAKVTRLVRDRIIPPPVNGIFNPGLVVKAYIAHLQDERENPIVTASELASYLNVTDVYVAQLARQGLLMRRAKGKYPLRENIIAFIQWKDREQTGVERTDLQEETLRLKREQRLMAEIQRKAAERENISSAECEAGWIMLASMAANAIESLASRLAHSLSPEQREIVDREARTVRQDLSDELTKLASEIR